MFLSSFSILCPGFFDTPSDAALDAKVEEFTQTSPYHVATIRLIEERDPEENSQDMSSNVKKRDAE